MESVVKSGRNRNSRPLNLFIDFEKAYDSVIRAKLFQILLDRCECEQDRVTAGLIA